MPFLTGAVKVSLTQSGPDYELVHGCAVLGTPDAAEPPQGEVWCWGHNDADQLGRGAGAEGGIQLTAAPVLLIGTSEPITGVSDVLTGPKTTCAIKDAALYCWGQNASYDLMGNGGGADQPLAVPSFQFGFEGLTRGYKHFCGLKNGDARCWGANEGGATGMDNGSGTKATPTAVDKLSEVLPGPVASLHAGGLATCAIDDAGLVACWGQNGSYARFGQGLYYSPDYLDVIGLDGPIPE